MTFEFDLNQFSGHDFVILSRFSLILILSSYLQILIIILKLFNFG